MKTSPLQQSDPEPFDIDSFMTDYSSTMPIEKMAEVRKSMADALYPMVKPFLGQGYNAMASLNRGTAAFYTHLDSIADFVSKSTGMEKEGLFDNMAKISSDHADYWKKRVDEVGINFLDEIISEAVGGLVPGVTQFALDVASGFTFPYMAGAADAVKAGERPFVEGMKSAAKTATLDGLFKMMAPLKMYLKAPSFGTVFGMEEAAVAPEGQKGKAFVKGAAIGAMYAATSPGGRLGLNEVKEAAKQAYEDLASKGFSTLKPILNESGQIKIDAIHWSKDKIEVDYDLNRLGSVTEGYNKDAAESAKLGAWFTESKEPISEKATVKNDAELSLKNPLVLTNDSVPPVDVMGEKIQDAKQWLMDEVERAGGGEALRKELQDKGYDGIILEDSEFNNQKSYVVFDKENIKFQPPRPMDILGNQRGSVEIDTRLKESKITTLRGRIKQMEGGGINPGNMKGEFKDVTTGTKYLLKKNGEHLDIAEQTLRDEGWLRADENLVDVLRDPENLRRNKVAGEGVAKREQYLTEQEREFKKGMEFEPEAPPEGNYQMFNAEDLPEGKKLTIIDDSAHGWDVYEVTEKDPFGVTLKDGHTIELKPGDKIQVRQEDMQPENITGNKGVSGPPPPPASPPTPASPQAEPNVTGEKRQRMFLKTVEESEKAEPTLKEGIAKIEPQDYFIQPNKESFGGAVKRIETEGVESALEWARDPKNITEETAAEAGAIYHEAIKKYQAMGDWDKAIELTEEFDRRGRGMGRFTQTAAMWSKLLSPEGFIRWGSKMLAGMENKYGWASTLFGIKPKWLKEREALLAQGKRPGYFSKEEHQWIIDKYREIDKLTDPIDKADATLELIDMVANKVPPSVSEMVDAYRYQNMLSSPRTQLRNIFYNMGTTFLTRPGDIATIAGIDWIKSGLFDKEREHYINGVPAYYKAAANAVPNAATAFMEVMRLGRGVTLGKPELGVEAQTAFEAARAKQMPGVLTGVQRFMEAQDIFNKVLFISGEKNRVLTDYEKQTVEKLNQALISAGEMTRLMKEGVPEADAHQRAQELADKYLLRNNYERGDPELSIFSRALQGLADMLIFGRKMGGNLNPIKWYVPFIKTPINLGIENIERSPLGLFKTKWTEESVAKIVQGSAVSVVGLLFAASGNTTWSVPTNKDEKELQFATNRKPYSITIAGYHVPMVYFGPYSLALALPAAIKYHTVDNNKSITKDGLEKLTDISLGMAQYLGSQTSTQSIGALFSILSGDVDFKLSSATGFTAQQMLPGSGLVRFVNSIVDDVYRHPRTFREGIEANIPILSKDIEPYRKPFGELSRRDPVNYFLPYDIGRPDKSSKNYEQIYQMLKPGFIAGANDAEYNEIAMKLETKRITLDEAIKQYFEVGQKVQDKILKEMKENKK